MSIQNTEGFGNGNHALNALRKFSLLQYRRATTLQEETERTIEVSDAQSDSIQRKATMMPHRMSVEMIMPQMAQIYENSQSDTS